MLPEEITKYEGKLLGTRKLEVEKGAIRKYADAVGDYNPLYWDEEYARRLGYRSILAPPGFFGWPERWHPAGPLFTEETEPIRDALARLGLGVPIDGGMDFEFFRPVQAGDVLTASFYVKDLVDRTGKAGRLVFWIAVTEYADADGQPVASARMTFIHR